MVWCEGIICLSLLDPRMYYSPPKLMGEAEWCLHDHHSSRNTVKVLALHSYIVNGPSYQNDLLSYISYHTPLPCLPQSVVILSCSHGAWNSRPNKRQRMVASDIAIGTFLTIIWVMWGCIRTLFPFGVDSMIVASEKSNSQTTIVEYFPDSTANHCKWYWAMVSQSAGALSSLDVMIYGFLNIVRAYQPLSLC